MTDNQIQRDPHHEGEYVSGDDAIIGRAFKWSMLVICAAGLVALVLFLVLNREVAEQDVTDVVVEPPQRIVVANDPPQVSFTDITESSGISFVHFNGATGDKLLPESIGAGVAIFDYDGDGDQDLFFANGMSWPWDERVEALPALYRNDGSGRFEDVSASVGLSEPMYGMGVAVGDYDSDGRTDVYLTNVGKNVLLRNQVSDGHVTLVDVTDLAGVGGLDSDWSTCASFFDADADGDLDLYVGNYVKWSREIDFEVDYRLVGMGRSYGPPMNYEGTFSYFYRNDDGTFIDASAEAGVHVTNVATGREVGKALGVSPIDVDGDGWMDLAVANDTVQNFLFHNQRDGTFKESGVEFGLAFDRNGSSTGAMGIDAGYYRNDTTLGFFIGNFANEMTSLYVSQENALLFADEAISEGIGSPTRLMLSFGVMLMDYDLDGRQDLLQANGHLEEEINVVQPSQHYEQPSQLFWNGGPDSARCFIPVAADTTGDLSKPIVGRGSAFGDLDGDGDLDVVLTQVARRPLVLRNDQSLGHHWIRFKVEGDVSNTCAIGARVEIDCAGSSQTRLVMPTRSYLSQSELPVTFGLGTSEVVDRVRVVWPGGAESVLTDVPADRVVRVTPP